MSVSIRPDSVRGLLVRLDTVRDALGVSNEYLAEATRSLAAVDGPSGALVPVHAAQRALGSTPGIGRDATSAAFDRIFAAASDGTGQGVWTRQGSKIAPWQPSVGTQDSVQAAVAVASPRAGIRVTRTAHPTVMTIGSHPVAAPPTFQPRPVAPTPPVHVAPDPRFADPSTFGTTVLPAIEVVGPSRSRRIVSAVAVVGGGAAAATYAFNRGGTAPKTAAAQLAHSDTPERSAAPTATAAPATDPQVDAKAPKEKPAATATSAAAKATASARKTTARARRATANPKYELSASDKITVKHHKASKKQRANIEAVLDQGRKMHAKREVLVAAVATITQEAEAKNIDYGDRDSIGLFQQRSVGWGSRESRMDPRRASQRFYEIAIPNNRRDPGMSITGLAQSVQRSGFADAYQQWANEADHTVDMYFKANG